MSISPLTPSFQIQPSLNIKPFEISKTDIIPKPDAIEVSANVPQIENSIVEKFQPYRSFRQMQIVASHPEKKEILTFINSQLHLYNSSGDFIQITDINKINLASFSPKGDFLIFTTESANEKHQLYFYDFINKPQLVSLNDTPLSLTADKYHRAIGKWSRDGSFAYMNTEIVEINGIPTAKRQLYTIDVEKPETNCLIQEFSNGHDWFVSDWSLDKQSILMQEHITENSSRLWIVNIKDGTTKPFVELDLNEKICHKNAVFDAEGNVVVITNKNRQFFNIAKINSQTGEYVYLTSDEYDVIEFSINPSNPHEIAFISIKDSFSTIQLCNGSKSFSLTNLPIGSFDRLFWGAKGSCIFFNVYNYAIPGEVFSFDIESQTAKSIAKLEAKLDPTDFPKPQTITWKSFDGMTITGLLYLPKNCDHKKIPVLINIHGGPELQVMPCFRGPKNYFLEELEVAIIFPDVRGSTGRGNDFLNAAYGVSRENAYQDIESLICWIEEQPYLDANKIILEGLSYGAHVALVAAARCNEKICGIISDSGISHLGNFLKTLAKENPERIEWRRNVYGDERDPEISKFYEKTAPINNAHLITKPTLIAYGSLDIRVPSSESEHLIQVLSTQNPNVWSVKCKDAGHIFSPPYLLNLKVVFIKQILGIAD